MGGEFEFMILAFAAPFDRMKAVADQTNIGRLHAEVNKLRSTVARLVEQAFRLVEGVLT